jgi:hypothetical protein
MAPAGPHAGRRMAIPPNSTTGIVDWHVRVAGERLEIVGSPLDADHARQRILVFGRCLDEIHLRLPRAFCSELDGVVDRATLA